MAAYAAACERWRIRLREDVLLVDLGEQKLTHWQRGKPAATYRIASSARPPSCVENSLGTPYGLHEIAGKHGAGQPTGMVFRARRATGRLYSARADAGPAQRQLVTTRILRLRGLEPGLNQGAGVDTFQRFIYIHGGNHPDRFPERLSAGCIHLADADLLALFAAVPRRSHVYIGYP